MSDAAATLITADGRRILITGRAVAIAVWVATNQNTIGQDHSAVRFDWSAGPPKVKTEHNHGPLPV